MQRENVPANSESGWLSSAYKLYQNVAPSAVEDTDGSPRRGGKREKLANVLRAANEMRQNYYAPRGSPAIKGSRWNEGNAYAQTSSEEPIEYVASGKEEIILFPTWGRKGIYRVNRTDEIAEPNLSSKSDATVDISVQGWIYTPHTAFPPTKKSRFATAMVTKLCGLPPLPTAADMNQDSDPTVEDFSSTGVSADEKFKRQNSSTDASRGGIGSRFAWLASRYGPPLIQQSAPTTPPAAIEEAHDALQTRLAPFLATPSFNMPLTAFFYNTRTAQSSTAKTDSLGHFTIHQSLPFVPTHVRILAGESLCAEDEVELIDVTSGISVISDIDDTIKVSGIGSGLREMFRNIFTREMSTMPVSGVAEWFRELAQPPYQVQIHYLSNSPWQLFPFLKELLVRHMKLPLGTWHLKKYSGFVQGIFEPVIERKKESLEMLLNNFPGRRWILVGDGGEGDLEVYTDVVRRWPGKVIAVYIRDVSGIGEEVLGTGSMTHSELSNETNFFDRNTTGIELKSVNFAETPSSDLRTGFPLMPLERKPHSPQRTSTHIPEKQQRSESGLYITSDNRTTTWDGTSSIVTQTASPSLGKTVPPPVPSKPPELRGVPRLPLTIDARNIPKQGTGSTKKAESDSDDITALYDGRDYGPPSPKPPPLPRRKTTTSATIGSSHDSGPGESSFYSPSEENPAASLATSQASSVSQLKPLDKKAELWKRRWEYAKQILADQGVVLMSWKEGQDVHQESIELVKNIIKNKDRSFR